MLAVIADGLASDGWDAETCAGPGPLARLVACSGGRRVPLEISARHLEYSSRGRPLPTRFNVYAPRHPLTAADDASVKLLLVYWEQLGVLVALDPIWTQLTRRAARVRLGTSLLLSAYERGVALDEGQSSGGAVAMLPGLLGHYILNQQALHDLARSHVAQEINSLLSHCEPFPDDTIRSVAHTRGSTASGLLLAVRSWRFRERVLSAYGHRCAICGSRCHTLATLKIAPWPFPASSDETSNGLALCPNHHQAYDKALITINPQYQVLFSHARGQSLTQANLHSGVDAFVAALRPVIVLPAEDQLRPRRDLLELGGSIRGWAG